MIRVGAVRILRSVVGYDSTTRMKSLCMSSDAVSIASLPCSRRVCGRDFYRDPPAAAASSTARIRPVRSRGFDIVQLVGGLNLENRFYLTIKNNHSMSISAISLVSLPRKT